MTVRKPLAVPPGIPVTIDGEPHHASNVHLDVATDPSRLVLSHVNLGHLLHNEVTWTVDTNPKYSGRAVVHIVEGRKDEPMETTLLVTGPIERKWL